MKRKYEIGFILNPESSEEEVKKITDFIVGIIDKAEGSVENIDEWGRKKMAYPIQKHMEGIYIFVNTDVAGSAISEIERRLKLSERVIRFIVVRLDERLKKSNRLTKRWKKMEKTSRKPPDPPRKEVEEEYVRKKEKKEDKDAE